MPKSMSAIVSSSFFRSSTINPLSTQRLFKILSRKIEENDIYGAISEGARLNVKQKQGHFAGNYPIHIAAHNVEHFAQPIQDILRSYDNATERNACIFLKNNQNQTALDILILHDHEDKAITSIVCLLSYLTADEQKTLLKSLSKTAKKRLTHEEEAVFDEQDIYNLATLNYFLKLPAYIDTTRQRRLEIQQDSEGYDSGDEGLGQLQQIEHKKFVARFSYRSLEDWDGSKIMIPTLELIPSDWRLQTCLMKKQGDHVSAYILLLSSFAHCQGENVKTLPQRIHELIMRALPDDQTFFTDKKNCCDNTFKQQRITRKKTVAVMKAHSDESADFIANVDINMKTAEMQTIAQYIEDVADAFISRLNCLKEGAFAQERKASLSKPYLSQTFRYLLKNHPILQDKKHDLFVEKLMDTVKKVMSKTTSSKRSNNQLFKEIHQQMAALSLDSSVIPSDFLSRNQRLHQTHFLAFLNDNFPCKKYHEGTVIKAISTQLKELATQQKERLISLKNIGYECFKLFDYPYVPDQTLNDEYVLSSAIARHWIILHAAFEPLSRLSYIEKEQIYDTFLEKILTLQGWYQHQTTLSEHDDNLENLTLATLKEKVLTVAELDETYQFSMKPKPVQQHHQPTKQASLKL